MSARFDFILRDKIKKIGDEQMFLRNIPEERRLAIFNAITFCSLGDEAEAVASIKSLIKLMKLIADNPSLSQPSSDTIKDMVCQVFRAWFAATNLDVAIDPDRKSPRLCHKQFDTFCTVARSPAGGTPEFQAILKESTERLKDIAKIFYTLWKSKEKSIKENGPKSPDHHH